MRWLLASLVALAWPQQPAPVFRDITALSGVNFKSETSPTSRKYLPESMVGGVAALDYNDDGRPDLYFVNGAALSDPTPKGTVPQKSDPKYWNRLYRNEGNGRFTDVTEKAGVAGKHYGMGAAAADFDNDGHADLYVTAFPGNVLYRNNGDGTFSDVTAKAGVTGGGWSSGAAFLDFDRDGHLDLFVSRYVEWDFEPDLFCGQRKEGHRSYCHPDQFKPITHLLYRNNGDGTFTDVSKTHGIAASPGKGLGVAVADVNRDGWPDIVVANDSFPQQLFINQKGRFKESGLVMGMAYDEDGHTFAGMGIDVTDIDNDGWPDIFVNALANQKYALFRNGKGIFEYATSAADLASITMLHSGWGARLFDFDNDGWRDLFVAQGHVMDNIELTQPNLRYLEPLLLARNVNGKFRDVSAQAGEPFRVPRAARGAAVLDFNNDGALDLAIACNNREAVLLQNAGAPGNHWLMVQLQGRSSNRDGIGAMIRVVTAGREQRAFASPAGSYLSSHDKRLHFGLGAAKAVQLVEVEWPSGKTQRLQNVLADQILTVTEH